MTTVLCTMLMGAAGFCDQEAVLSAPLTGFERAAVYIQAEIPIHLWEEFDRVAYCEARYDPLAIGDGGLAKGLFQIHWNLWAQWAWDAGHGTFLYWDWQSPVKNTRLAYLIGEHYDLPRTGWRWSQWGCQP